MAEYSEQPAAEEPRRQLWTHGEQRRRYTGRFAGLHRWLGGFPTAFFTLALITDYVYTRTANLTWQYFSIWLITAALIMGGFAVLAGIVDLAQGGGRGRRGVWWHFGLTIVALLVGLLNAFVHSRDGWTAVVPEGILLSLLTVILLYAGGLAGALLDRNRNGADAEYRS